MADPIDPVEIAPAPPAASVPSQDPVAALAIQYTLDWLKQQVTGRPLAQAALQAVEEILTPEVLAELGATLSKLAGSGKLTLRGAVDTLCAYVESKETRPLIRVATQALNQVVDMVGLPLLSAYLGSKGIILPLS